jgi:DNA-binding NarL/FixJ family response regulator
VTDAQARRVLIADDHPPTRAGVRQSLADGGFEVCGEAADAKSAMTLAKELSPDVALIDIHMPGGGVSAIEHITRECPTVAVVVLTVSRNDDDLFDAVRAGALGYLLKDMDPDRLPMALQGVLEGEAALPRTMVARRVPRPGQAADQASEPVVGAAHQPGGRGARAHAGGPDHQADGRPTVRLVGDRAHARVRHLEEAGSARQKRGRQTPRPGRFAARALRNLNAGPPGPGWPFNLPASYPQVTTLGG